MSDEKAKPEVEPKADEATPANGSAPAPSEAEQWIFSWDLSAACYSALYRKTVSP